MNIKQIMATAGLVMVAMYGTVAVLSQPVMAADCKPDEIKKDEKCVQACGGVETSVIKCTQQSPDGKGVETNGVWGILLIALNILTAGVGVVAVGGLILAGITYGTASNDQAKVVKAKEMIFNVIVGLIMYMLMWAFAQYLIPGGIFK